MNYYIDGKIETSKLTLKYKEMCPITSLVPRYMVPLHQGSIPNKMNKLCLVEAEIMKNKLAPYTPNLYTHLFRLKGVYVQLVLPHYSQQTIYLP